MPIPVKSADELRPGDFFEDCAYHLCLCIGSRDGEVEGISLMDGSFPRQCGVPHCGVRKLTPEEAIIASVDALKGFRFHFVDLWRRATDQRCSAASEA
jgi:hypothetical protein